MQHLPVNSPQKDRTQEPPAIRLKNFEKGVFVQKLAWTEARPLFRQLGASSERHFRRRRGRAHLAPASHE